MFNALAAVLLAPLGGEDQGEGVPNEKRRDEETPRYHIGGDLRLAGTRRLGRCNQHGHHNECHEECDVSAAQIES